MKTLILAVVVAMLPIAAIAEDERVASVVQDHILPRFERLADTSGILAATAAKDCDVTSLPLRAAYSDAFDAWVAASHLRFGPTEVDDRAFALAFWPDSRGATPKILHALIANQDPVAANTEAYADVSIAARGFYALEFLLYDDALNSAGEAGYHCVLIRTVTADIAAITAAISDDWSRDYAARLMTPAENGTYRSQGEVLQELLKALSAGLQFTAETRLGRPLGTFDKARPSRAEAWRSGRSARHVALALRSLQDLAIRLAGADASLAMDLNAAFESAQAQVADLVDPIFAGVDRPQGRLKVEIIQQSVEAIRSLVRDRLGPELGVAAGFNAMDGD